MKKLLFVFLIFFSAFCAAAITDYNVSQNVPLGQHLTIEGIVSPAVDSVQCSFQIFTLDGNFVYRLTDEYTNPAGVFSSSYFVFENESILKRGIDYNAVTYCGSDSASATFSAIQRETISHVAEQETLYLFQRGNLESFAFFGSILLFFVVVVIIGVYWFNRSRRFFSGNRG